jgi:hypothetical protein
MDWPQHDSAINKKNRKWGRVRVGGGGWGEGRGNPN